MYTQIEDMQYKLEEEFDEGQARLLSKVITEAYNELVKTSDFNELKAIVKDIAEVQRETDRKMGELAEAQKETRQELRELAESHKELAESQKGLTEAQNRTEERIKELTLAVKDMGNQVGGLGNSMGYALENEAYRMLPKILKERFGIEVSEKVLRIEIGGREINVFAKAKRDGKDILLVGETKVRLGTRRTKNIFEELEDKVEAVREEYPDAEIVEILVTHFANESFLREAKKEGVIVVQSFEW
ncbi:MAG: hypothetical protein V1872_11515 [bacterium]